MQAATISEPATVFYGRIMAYDTSGAHPVLPFLLDRGTLEWTLRAGDNSEQVLHTRIQTLHDGAYNYRLDIPQQALALGLETAGAAIGLKAAGETYYHASISIDGSAAEIIGPNGRYFDLAQARRAATYRLDLRLPFRLTDSDGDGIADWWEDRYGLDKQNPHDALLDNDGDGLDQRQEYRLGADPGWDNRRPQLVTTELFAYASAVNGVALQAI